MVEDGLWCDISKSKLVRSSYYNLQEINRLQDYSDSEVRYLNYRDFRILEYYHKWSETITRVGKDDHVYLYEDRRFFFFYHGVCIKTNHFTIENNVGLPPFEYNLPERIKTLERDGWLIEEIKELKYHEDLTKDFQLKINEFCDSGS